METIMPNLKQALISSVASMCIRFASSEVERYSVTLITFFCESASAWIFSSSSALSFFFLFLAWLLAEDPASSSIFAILSFISSKETFLNVPVPGFLYPPGAVVPVLVPAAGGLLPSRLSNGGLSNGFLYGGRSDVPVPAGLVWPGTNLGRVSVLGAPSVL